MSTPTTTDYTTQGDANQVASPTPTEVQQQNNVNQYIDKNNYFIPDGSNRRIHDIWDKVFHTGYLENGNNAYLLHLPKLQDMLHTSRFLMDETSGQFYAIYGNTYQKMSTKPMLKAKWGPGELINQLAATRQVAMQDCQDQHHVYSIHHQPTMGKMTSYRRNQHQRLSSTNHHLSASTDQ